MKAYIKWFIYVFIVALVGLIIYDLLRSKGVVR